MSGLVKSLLGMGNPLLDIIADVDQALLDKYHVRRLANCWRVHCLCAAHSVHDTVALSNPLNPKSQGQPRPPLHNDASEMCIALTYNV